uniref:nucleoside diphosphate phosphatase n=1 Tax=Neolamprologus brichardi TaxID=32507 RepID=A0A3Q4I299_NEOBR
MISVPCWLSQAQLGNSFLDFSWILPSLSRPANHSRIFYAVMFDAGSTGTRIHVYTFIQKQLPMLDNEMFHSIKPGLSAYVDVPETAGETVRMLLKVAKRTVPRVEWKRTPLVLRATAGLRLLPAQKAQALLDQVQHVFDESPFLVSDDGVSIMNGKKEGNVCPTSAPTSHLKARSKKTVGILDLGGGSTQITFLPKLRKTTENADAVFLSPPGYTGYKLCYQEVLKVVKGIIHQPYELEDTNVFYAFSYYFDRAVDAGLIDEVHGGMLEVRDFKKRAKEVCNKMTKYPPIHPFLCMDMTYITCLLKDGFGFKENTVLQLTKKVNNVEASWALGATLDHFHYLKIH